MSICQDFEVDRFAEFYRQYRCPGAPADSSWVFKYAGRMYQDWKDWVPEDEFLALLWETVYLVFTKFKPEKYRGQLHIEDHFVNFFATYLRGELTRAAKKVMPRKGSKKRPIPADWHKPDQRRERWTPEDVREALTRLPPKQQRLLQYRYWEGMSNTEIQVQLDIPRSTVQRHLQNALDRLRVELEKIENKERFRGPRRLSTPLAR